MLQSEWEHCPAAAAGTAKARSGAASGWKGRNAAMATLLKYLVLHTPKPLDMLLKLAESLMEATLSDSEYAGLFMIPIILSKDNINDIVCFHHNLLCPKVISINLYGMVAQLLKYDGKYIVFCSLMPVKPWHMVQGPV